MVEEEIARRYKEQDMRCPVHLSIGQEAAAVGICSAMKKSDWVFSGHRNHAHYLAKGGNLKKMLSEIYGKLEGCSGGKGGSMHMTDIECGFIASTPIVGSTVPIAAGAALKAKEEDEGRLVTVFFGDGAMESGIISETMNFAALKGLPIVFVCEDNKYSVYSPKDVRQPENRSLTQLAIAHGLKAENTDGNDCTNINKIMEKARKEVIEKKTPYFIELETYRWREHCGPNYDNDIGYRSEEEFREWKKRDPIQMLRGNIDESTYLKHKEEIKKEIDNSFEYAISREIPRNESISHSIYALGKDFVPVKRGKKERLITYAQAVNEAQDIGLRQYDEAYIMGLGVPDPKGIFGTTCGLKEKYGSNRVFDTPLAEAALTGIAIGSAIKGMRPILTHQRLDFSLVSMDQIVNQAAKWRYMFNGEMDAGITIRMIIGRGWGQGPQHSQNLQAWFAHIPGLRVVAPSNGYDAKGMILASLDSKDPVLILEHRWLHNTCSDVPAEGYRCSLEKAEIKEKGKDLTLIANSYGVVECVEASKRLKEKGVRCEVIDLRSINPIDKETIKRSVMKTGKVIVVDHAEASCGIASEIISIICEDQDINLTCKPIRLTCPNHPAPTSHFMIRGYYPDADNIEKVVLDTLDIKHDNEDKDRERVWDVPNPEFKGPF